MVFENLCYLIFCIWKISFLCSSFHDFAYFLFTVFSLPYKYPPKTKTISHQHKFTFDTKRHRATFFSFLLFTNSLLLLSALCDVKQLLPISFLSHFYEYAKIYKKKIQVQVKDKSLVHLQNRRTTKTSIAWHPFIMECVFLCSFKRDF